MDKPRKRSQRGNRNAISHNFKDTVHHDGTDDCLRSTQEALGRMSMRETTGEDSNTTTKGDLYPNSLGPSNSVGRSNISLETSLDETT